MTVPSKIEQGDNGGEQQQARLENELLAALRTKQLVIDPSEINGRSFVTVLRERLTRA